MPRRRRSLVCVALIVILGGCAGTDVEPTPSSSASTVPPSRDTESPLPSSSLPTAPVASPSAPAATVLPQSEFPLAVVTGIPNLQSTVELAGLQVAVATDSGIVVPCEVETVTFALPGGPATVDGPLSGCLPADQIVDAIAASPETIALLPAGAVEPAIKVLPVDGADLFGSGEARAAAYPITGTAIGLPPDATAYDANSIRTLTSVGESCPDRGVAYAALTLGRGWEWVLGGGTAQYTAIYPNPAGPGQVGNGFDIVEAVQTGNEGAVWRLIGSADFTVEDFECPVVEDFTVNDGVVFSIDPAIPGLLAERGTDVVTLAANHLTDRGIEGLLETLTHFDEAGILHTGAGADLDAALEPAVFDAGGLNFAVVGWNIVPGAADAGPGQPGVAPTTQENVRESVARARAAAAEVVICMPQWGYPEYRAEFTQEELDWQQFLFAAGCNHILGHGTHWASAIDFTPTDAGVGFTILSHGNFLFGQGWSQQTQEGVIPELTFRGTELVQARLHPYVMIDQAQANLTNPQTDGANVLNRVYAASDLSY